MPGWPTFVASEKTVTEAKQSGRTVDGWGSFVAEAALNRWLTLRNHDNFSWVKREVRYKPDFFISGFRCDIITSRQEGKVTPEHIVSISKRHTLVSRAREYYFFVVFQADENRVWLLGGISHARLLREAEYDQEGNEYRIPASKLSTPDGFLYEVHLRQMFNAVEVFIDTPEGVTYNSDAAPRLSSKGKSRTPEW